ncbi:hypothetical protein B0680_07855 [Moraxella pluranimalium]|uniref:Chloramphenicol acetyltransferase n=2 Tax=Moraxella pluranimalium TaxID=470453 RepID=A0A1T0CLP4_9GAMM|nr:hypothetical protein B0680_07855 [Moraxella pluranimalium]
MNNKFIAQSAQISKSAIIHHPVTIGKMAEVHDRCILGSYSLVNNYSVLYSDVEVGRYCSIARFVEVGVAAHPHDWLSTSNIQYSNTLMRGHPDTTFRRKVAFEYDRETKIGNDVWIGAKSIIKSGVKIGHGAIIGGGAFVHRDVPDYAIVVGQPARILRFRFDDATIADLLELCWWDFAPKDLTMVDFKNVKRAIEQIKELKALPNM